MIDLHVHTTCSDGIFKPQEIINMSKLKGIDTISICDHNSIKAYDNLDTKDINIIKGIEFYAKKDNIGGTFHMLAYDFDNTKSFLKQMKYFDEKRKESMLLKLKYIKEKYKIEININDLDNTWLSNKALMDYLSSRYDYTYSQDIINYIRSLKIKTDRKLDYKNIIDLVISANGIPVLAHPKTIKCDDMDYFIEDLVDNGLMGIEVYHSSHDLRDIKMYLELAKKYNLLISGGSDFHGLNHKNSLGDIVTLGNSNISSGINDASILRYIRSKK